LGRPVFEVKEWPISEVQGWFEYLNRRPVDWRRDHCFSYILAALGSKEKPYELFGSLKAIEKDRQEREEKDHSGDANKLVASGFLGNLIKKSDWDVKVEK